MTGEELTYRYQQKLKFQCSEFGADLVEGLLEVHWQTHHGVDKGLGGEEKWETPHP